MEVIEQELDDLILQLKDIKPDKIFLDNFIFGFKKFLPARYFLLIIPNKTENTLEISIFLNHSDAIEKKIVKILNIKHDDFLSTYLDITSLNEIGLKYYRDNLFAVNIDDFKFHALAILSIPLLIGGKLKGFFSAFDEIDFISLTKEKKAKLEILSSILALLLDNQQLLEENESKDRLSVLGQSIISSAHGLKNILNNIDGGVFIVEKGAQKKNMEEVSKGWEIVRRNSNRVRDLVLDILLFSRPKKPEYKYSSINDICKDIKELLEESAKKSNVEIINSLDSDIGEVIIDPKGIYRCILNLASNAIHACEEKGRGRVTIRTKLKSISQIEISVSDTGTGISKENLNHIFNTFFTTKGSKGTGLGLSVTEKIVKEHGGTIEVKTMQNIGTTFTIKLPIDKNIINSPLITPAFHLIVF
jgi:signal transduction histidine kinase